MSLLLLFGGASGVTSFTPLTFTETAALLLPDEVAIGQQMTVYAQIIDSTGPLALDEAAQLAVYGFDTNGVRSEVSPLAVMTQVAAADLWAGTWTPTAAGTYEVVVAMKRTTVYPVTRSITVRPQFDPIGFALDEVLVSRTGDADLLGTV